MPFWESSIFWGVAGIVGGFIVAAFFFYIGKAKKSLVYQILTANLITDEINNLPGLKISVGDEPATNLASTTVKFINNGNQTISSSDFASLSPLHITASKHIFNIANIDTSYIKARNKTLNPSINVVRNDSIIIGFEYLKPKQQFEITVLHDGKLSVGGDLKTGLFQSYDSALKRPNRKHIQEILLPLLTGIIFVIIASMILFSVVNENGNNLNSFDSIRNRIYELQDEVSELRSIISDLKSENQQLQDTILSLTEDEKTSEVTNGHIPDSN